MPRNAERACWSADERASPELRAASFGEQAAYSLPFRNHFRGVWLRHGGFWPDRHVRLFRREACRYDPRRTVHEKLIVEGPVGRLDAPILHFTYDSLQDCLAKMDRYGEQAARMLHGQGVRASAWEIALRPLWRFLRGYVLRLGFLDGRPGLFFCGLLAFYDFLAAANRYELRVKDETCLSR